MTLASHAGALGKVRRREGPDQEADGPCRRPACGTVALQRTGVGNCQNTDGAAGSSGRTGLTCPTTTRRGRRGWGP